MQLELDMLLRFAVALILSAVIGWEREKSGKPAGLRTHMLVGAGASLFVGLGVLLVMEFSSFGDRLRFDPMRIIEGVVTGVSFLGAGTIFFSRDRDKVQGLTTAASLWTTAAVGIAVGLERYVLAVGVTAMLFLVLHGVTWIERRMPAKQTGPERTADDSRPSA
jgi:putative Mg2+ transporter-C (MgtC) family protein